MTLLRCVLVCAFLAGTAFGQTVTPVKLPVANQHNCNEAFYPPQAMLEDREGLVTLAFAISPGGTVVDPQIIQSSGDAELDRAALACVKTWTYGEGVVQSVYIPWKVRVLWRVAPHNPAYDGYTVALENLRADAWNCVRRSIAAHALPVDFSGIMETLITLPKDRAPAVQIVQSSGRSALDEQFVACASQSPWLDKVNAAAPYPTYSATGFAWYPGLAQ